MGKRDYKGKDNRFLHRTYNDHLSIHRNILTKEHLQNNTQSRLKKKHLI